MPIVRDSNWDEDWVDGGNEVCEGGGVRTRGRGGDGACEGEGVETRARGGVGVAAVGVGVLIGREVVGGDS